MNKLFLTIICVAFFITSASAEIRILSKKGEAAYKTVDRWIPIVPNAVLPVGAKISTGVRASVELDMNGHKVTIKEQTMVKIFENSVKKDTSTTQIALKRGSIRVRVSRQEKIKTVFQVASPVATSSVRGSDDTISYGPEKGHLTISYKGSVEAESRNGSNKLLSGWLVFKQRTTQPQSNPFFDDIKDVVFNSTSFVHSTPEEAESREFYFGDMPDTGAIGRKGGAAQDIQTPNTRIILIWP